MRAGRLGRLAVVAATGAALFALAFVSAADAAPAPPGGSIAYQSLRNGRWRIVRMNSDGTAPTVLPGKGNDTLPVWLPDGRILFNSDRGGTGKIYTMAADGTDVRLVTTGTASEKHEGVGGGGNLVLVRLGPRSFRIRNLATGAVKRLSFAAFPGVGGELWPAISPDGARIAFLFKGGTGAGRAVYAARLTEGPIRYAVGKATKVAVGCFNAWGADSTRFLMCIIKDQAKGSDLYLATLGADGRWTRTRVTTAVNWDYFPAWSPDNSWIVWAASPIAYHDHGSPTYEIWSRPAAGGDPVRLTRDGYTDNAPSWSAPLP